MIRIVPKFPASDRQGDHHGVAIRIAIAKCRGWFDHVTLEEKALVGEVLKITHGATWRAMALVTICLCVFGAAPKKTLAQAQVTGKWVTLPYLMPINPIRVGL